MVFVFPAGAPTTTSTAFHLPSRVSTSSFGNGKGKSGSVEAARFAVAPPKRSQPVSASTSGRSTANGPKSSVTPCGSASPRKWVSRNLSGERTLPSSSVRRGAQNVVDEPKALPIPRIEIRAGGVLDLQLANGQDGSRIDLHVHQ